MSNNRVIIGLRFFAPLEPGPGRGAKIDNTLPKKKIPARITKFYPGLGRCTALTLGT